LREEGEVTRETGTLPSRIHTPPPLRQAAFDDEDRAYPGYLAESPEPDDIDYERVSAAQHSIYSGIGDQRSTAYSPVRFLRYSTPNLGRPVRYAPGAPSPSDPLNYTVPLPDRSEPEFPRQRGEGEAGPSRLRRVRRETTGHRESSLPFQMMPEARRPTTERSMNRSYSSRDSTVREGEIPGYMQSAGMFPRVHG
jgi:hypothetical protein